MVGSRRLDIGIELALTIKADCPDLTCTERTDLLEPSFRRSCLRGFCESNLPSAELRQRLEREPSRFKRRVTALLQAQLSPKPGRPCSKNASLAGAMGTRATIGPESSLGICFRHGVLSLTASCYPRCRNGGPYLFVLANIWQRKSDLVKV
jgi:hypothetical protein